MIKSVHAVSIMILGLTIGASCSSDSEGACTFSADGTSASWEIDPESRYYDPFGTGDVVLAMRYGGDNNYNNLGVLAAVLGGVGLPYDEALELGIREVSFEQLLETTNHNTWTPTSDSTVFVPEWITGLGDRLVESQILSGSVTFAKAEPWIGDAFGIAHEGSFSYDLIDGSSVTCTFRLEEDYDASADSSSGGDWDLD